jgi:hypothetical protein
MQGLVPCLFHLHKHLEVLPVLLFLVLVGEVPATPTAPA